MHRRLYAQLAALIALPALGGCVQMTRHSNMMIFGTNTVVGIKLGVNATSVPEISVGFTRQEAVVLPLVANVSESTQEPGNLVPCDPRSPVTVTKVPADTRDFLVHPCSLVGVNGTAMDSYSVLASFGGKFETASENGSVKANGGVAQYFATGVAAQTLALNGGAAVVASSDAAKAAAGNPPVKATTASLYSDAAQLAQARADQKDYATAIAAVSKQISQTAGGSKSALDAQIKIFEAALGVTERLTCTDVQTCASEVIDDDWHQTEYLNTPDKGAKFRAAANAAWPGTFP